MKRFKMLIPLLMVIACQRSPLPSGNGKVLTFSAEDVVVNCLDATRISDDVTGSTHVFSWEEGDCLRLFAFKAPVSTGESHISDLGTFKVVKTSEGMFFRGTVTNIDLEADQIFAVWRDRPEITYNSTSESYNGQYFYKIFNAIDELQTGNPEQHMIFAANNGKIDQSAMKMTQPLSFALSTPIIRFGVTADRDIESITISSPGVNFVGSKIQMRTNMRGLNSGWNKSVIQLKDGAVLVRTGETRQLGFASSQLTKKQVPLVFTFKSIDGSTCSRTWTSPDAVTVANNIYNIGNVTTGNWSDEPIPDEGESAAEAVANMGIGTNLCCTFECGLDYEQKGATREDPVSFETMTARSKTTQATMDALAAAGFNTIRIPVTWYPHMDNTLATIDKVWLDRLGEVVQYALNAGMYAIINVHADAGNNANTWLVADYENYEDINARFVNIWGQIAQYFRDYDYRLIFEGYNEIVDRDRTWFWPKEYSSITAANALNQSFVNTVRSSGGYNVWRNLCVNTFSAGTWANTLQNFVLPADSSQGQREHLMVQVHSYKPADFCTADLSRATYEFGSDDDVQEIENEFENIRSHLLSKGYPCVLGEYGSFPTKARPDKARGHHAAVYTRKCLQNGIAPLYWYNPMDYQQRSAGNWTYPELKDSIVTAYKKHLEQIK